MDAFEKISTAMGDAQEGWKKHPLFYAFEPWDVVERPQALLDQALHDHVDLYENELVQAVGNAPHGFQTDYLLDETFGRVILSAGRIGKSLCVLMEILMSATGELPLCFRYHKGYDTGVARPITPENIIRWGRRSKGTDEIIDHDARIVDDGSWDCGNIIGVGVFPQNKIVPAGGMIRLASYESIIKQVWWPAFTGEGGSELARFVPKDFIETHYSDQKKKGFHVQERWVMLKRNVRLQMITYESKKKAFEGAEPPAYLDEEPPDEDLLGSMWTHCSRWSLSETPWRGITYTRGLAFPETRNPLRKTYHATLYDCPYRDAEYINRSRSELEDKPWEMAARIWGIPADVQGKPYYDRMKINLWLQKFKPPHRLVTFSPTADWDRIKTNNRISRLPGLLDTPVVMSDAETEDKQAVWRLYEDRQDGVGYVLASDQADGAELVEEVGDWSACSIGRQLDVETDPTTPVLCATVRSALPTPQFAREVLYAARYFNNGLLAPESAKGAANATFEAVCTDWPWWFKDTVEKWSTRKPKEHRGFCPTPDRRETVFDKLIRDWLDGHDEETYPNIPDEWILRELSAAIIGTTKGKTATRCDHPNSGTLDSAFAWGIMLFVFQAQFVRQIKCRGGKIPEKRKLNWLEQAEEAARRQENPVLAGLGETLTPMGR